MSAGTEDMGRVQTAVETPAPTSGARWQKMRIRREESSGGGAGFSAYVDIVQVLVVSRQVDKAGAHELAVDLAGDQVPTSRALAVHVGVPRGRVAQR